MSSVDFKINEAIRDCLDRYQQGRSPLAHLAACLDTLRSSPEWTEAEIRAVDVGARKILIRLMVNGPAVKS